VAPVGGLRIEPDILVLVVAQLLEFLRQRVPGRLIRRRREHTRALRDVLEAEDRVVRERRQVRPEQHARNEDTQASLQSHRWSPVSAAAAGALRLGTDADSNVRQAKTQLRLLLF